MAKYSDQVSGLVESRVREALDTLVAETGESFGAVLRVVIDYGLAPAAEHYARRAAAPPEPPEVTTETIVVDIEAIRAARRG